MGIDDNLKRRKAFTKIEREEIYNKTNGRCGYCGELLNNRWHIDHIIPISNKQGNNNKDNLMASCPSCNNYKHSFSVDGFRKELNLQIRRLNDNSVNYRLAKRYNQIKETPNDIIFYFEKLKQV